MTWPAHQLAMKCIALISSEVEEPSAQIVQDVACKMLDIVKRARALTRNKAKVREPYDCKRK
jgi:hypothetical protein